MNNRTTVRAIFADGNEITSTINLNYDDAKKYYLGTSFTFGIGENEKSVECVKVLPIVSAMSEELLRDQYIDCFRIGNDEIQLRFDDGTGHQLRGFHVKRYDNTVIQEKRVLDTYTEAVLYFMELVNKVCSK